MFYKIIEVNKNDITKIIIFVGKYFEYSADQLNTLYEKDKTNVIFLKVLGEELKDHLISNPNVPLYFSSQYIYSDDTIEIVKLKITQEIKISYEEIYLFGKQNKKFSSVELYKKATTNRIFTRELCRSLLNNYIDIDHSFLDDASKDIITYNDLFALNADDTESECNIPIGINYKELSDFITINPFSCLTYDDSIISDIDSHLNTNNHELIFENSSLKNNALFVCSAENVIEHFEENKVSFNLMCKIYFPLLAEKNIFTKEDIISNRLNIGIPKSVEKYNKSIDTLHEINKLGQRLNIIDEGINYINFIIYTKVKVDLALDLIFKLLHVNETMAFISYNPGKSIENIYKLYSVEQAENGNKIPYLSKNIIFKLIKLYKRPKCVALYISNSHDSIKYELKCEILENGHIYVYGDFETYFNVKILEEIFKKDINPIIETLQKHFDDNKIIFTLFESLNDTNIEILDTKYNYNLNIKKRFSINKFIGCLSGVFNVSEHNLLNGIKMRYKRVSNYSETNSMETFLTELINKQTNKDEIVYALETNYKITNEKAKEKLNEFFSNIQILQKQNENRVLKIKNSPGFLTEININKNLNPGYNITISINSLDNINYLEHIPVYIFALIKLSQGVVNDPEFLRLCSSTKIQLPSIFNDIENVREDENLHAMKYYNNAANYDSDIDFLLDDDENDDEEEIPTEIISGGSNISDELSSINNNSINSELSSLNISSKSENGENDEEEQSLVVDNKDNDDIDENELSLVENENEEEDENDENELPLVENENEEEDENDENELSLVENENDENDEEEPIEVSNQDLNIQDEIIRSLQEDQENEADDSENQADDLENQADDSEDQDDDLENQADDEGGQESDDDSVADNVSLVSEDDDSVDDSSELMSAQDNEIATKIEENKKDEENNELQDQLNNGELSDIESLNLSPIEDLMDSGDEGEETDEDEEDEITSPPNIEETDDIREIVEEEDKLLNLFCYGSNSSNQLNERLNVTNIIIKKAELNNYIRIFGGSSENWNNGAVASIIQLPNNKCLGGYASLTEEQLIQLDEFEKGYSRDKVVILNEENEEIEAFVYIKEDTTWTVHPDESYLQACCLLLIEHWPQLDGNQELIVKNNNNKIMGVYNYSDKSYIKYDDEDEFKEMDKKVNKIVLHPNPFLTKMYEKDPKLFYEKEDQQYSQYSRMCPSNIRRQPVILTQEEKDKIDKEHPGSYTSALYHGSDENTKYYYICPRYWSFKDNVSLREDEVSKENLIPYDAKTVSNPEQNYIYEFANKKGVYEEYNTPGFLDPSKHPDGLCSPCCFKIKAATSKLQQTRKEKCSKIPKAQSKKDDLIDDEERLDEMPPDFENIINIKSFYIKNHDKFPLEQNRWGHLPIVLQKFLSFDSNLCETEHKKGLVPNKGCLLRYGVENSKTQSFIGCISAAFIKYSTNNLILSIKEMKKKILESISIDNILTFQNGNIINIFANNDYNDIDITPYTNSELYSKYNEENMNAFKKIISGYTNFVNYLNDDKVTIDHKYLWDIICMPNDKLFKDGLNLIIMENKNYDITNNIHVICPSNVYSNNFFTNSKPTFMLYKEGDFYEPIFILYNSSTKTKGETNNNYRIRPILTFNDFSIIPGLYSMIKKISKNLKENCLKESYSNDTYIFKKNMTLSQILERISSKYNILKLILHYNNKVIGLVIENKTNKQSGFIPCYPSGMLNNYNYELINDEIWDTYSNTISFLIDVNKNTQIPCMPLFKVKDNELIVGILTETNQMILLNQPEPLEDIMDELKIIEDKNYLEIDKEIMKQLEEDKDRIINISKLRLEKQFYFIFRKLAKYHLNLFKNYKTRTKIEDILSDDTMLYLNKLSSITNILKPFLSPFIEFSTYEEKVLEKILNIELCNKDCDELLYCSSKDDISCVIMIPENHLITNKSNENIYFNRLSDELIRYSTIQSYIFEPSTQLFDINIDYNLKEDEMLVMQSSLTQDFFNDLIKENVSSYEKTKVHDSIFPSKDIKQLNILKLNEETDYIEEPISVEFENMFEFKEVYIKTYKDKSGFSLLIDILKDASLFEDPNKNIIKEKLLDCYNNYNNEYLKQLISILKKHGKQKYSKKLLENQIKFETMINDEDYYLCPLDLLLLSSLLSIPIILFVKNKKEITIFNLKDSISSTKFYCIIFNIETKRLHLLKTDFSNSIFKVILNETLIEKIESNNISILDYITKV